MQFVFFYPKNIQKYFLENYQFYRKCRNDVKSRGVEGGGHVLALLWRIAYENRHMIHP